ncbi:MAG: PQQ-dependent sugar dehydrogenase, partial [Ramlibacter sp.]
MQPAVLQAEVRAETVATGLSHPWAVAFVDGRFLVTERAGRMRVV